MPRKTNKGKRQQGRDVLTTVGDVLRTIDKVVNSGKKIHDLYAKIKKSNARSNPPKVRPTRSDDAPLTYGLKEWIPKNEESERD